MKRIQSACLEQIIHFQIKDGTSSPLAVREVQNEYENYKVQLTKNKTPFKILEEQTLPDGSILIHIKKQYSNQPIGSFLA